MVPYNSLLNFILVSHQTVENLVYNLRYGSDGPSSKSESYLSPSSIISMIHRVSSLSEYKLYSSLIGLRVFMTEETRENRQKVEDIVPRRFYRWLKVFGKQELERILVCKPWDYAIDLQEEFILRKGRIYLLSRIERKKVQVFVDSQLKKGYIQLNKSPQTSLVMFILKKDGKKRIVQDY